jgi:RNA polymerase sigma-70 factor (sigma-E family)
VGLWRVWGVNDQGTTSTDGSYAAFVRASWGQHLRTARLLTGDPDHGEELLQDCLVKLYVRWRRVAGLGDPHAYLRRMLVNARVSRWRRSRREQLVWDTPDQADPRALPREPHEQLRRALLGLPRQQRAVVVLRHYADLTEQEVATTLGCSIGTVKSHHARAIKRLRALLKNHELETILR